MSRTIPKAVLALLALLLIPAAAQDTELTVDQIVQKHTEALGGADKLKAIQNVTMSGKASLMGGQIEAPIVMKIKRPTSMRMEITVQDKVVVQAFDGTTGWIINPLLGSDDPQKSSEEDAKSARDDADFIDGSLVDYKAKGSTVELAGKEDVGGTPAYKLKVTKKGGNVDYDFLDAKTFLPIKSTGKREQNGKEIEFESTPGNFKPVNGVMMPFTLSQKVNGRSQLELTVEKVEVNTVMDDSVFKMPEKK